MYVLDKAWSEKLDIFKKSSRDCRCYGNDDVRKMADIFPINKIVGNLKKQLLFNPDYCLLCVKIRMNLSSLPEVNKVF